jgi:hypothetical protein
MLTSDEAVAGGADANDDEGAGKNKGDDEDKDE